MSCSFGSCAKESVVVSGIYVAIGIQTGARGRDKILEISELAGMVRASVIVRGCKIGRGEAVGFACERGE
jgi:hypothetical protein